MDFTGQISERAGMADLWEMMPMRLLSFTRSAFRREGRLGAKATGGWLVAVGLMGLSLVDGRAEAPASHKKTPATAPAANVSKLQAWKDAEAIAALAPGRSEVIGAGDSMKPVYGENTILVISKIG